MTITIPAEYQDYLVARYRSYDERAIRYRITAHIMLRMGMTLGDSVLDLGGGDAEMEKCLREEFGFEGVYYNYDYTTENDLYEFIALAHEFCPDFIVSLETIEHLQPFYARRLLRVARETAITGVVMTTPDATVQDVLAMDDTHLWGATARDFEAAGYEVQTHTLYDGFHSGGKPDGLVAWAPAMW